MAFDKDRREPLRLPYQLHIISIEEELGEGAVERRLLRIARGQEPMVAVDQLGDIARRALLRQAADGVPSGPGNARVAMDRLMVRPIPAGSTAREFGGRAAGLGGGSARRYLISMELEPAPTWTCFCAS